MEKNANSLKHRRKTPKENKFGREEWENSSRAFLPLDRSRRKVQQPYAKRAGFELTLLQVERREQNTRTHTDERTTWSADECAWSSAAESEGTSSLVNQK